MWGDVGARVHPPEHYLCKFNLTSQVVESFDGVQFFNDAERRGHCCDTVTLLHRLPQRPRCRVDLSCESLGPALVTCPVSIGTSTELKAALREALVV